MKLSERQQTPGPTFCAGSRMNPKGQEHSHAKDLSASKAWHLAKNTVFADNIACRVLLPNIYNLRQGLDLTGPHVLSRLPAPLPSPVLLPVSPLLWSRPRFSPAWPKALPVEGKSIATWRPPYCTERKESHPKHCHFVLQKLLFYVY